MFFQRLFPVSCSLKASVLQHSAFFRVQLSHLYVTTGKKHSFDYTDPCQHTLEQAKYMFIPLYQVVMVSMQPLGQGFPSLASLDKV